MVKSMTGFGRSEYQEGDRRFSVEIKAVNHRYLDLSIRLPKKISFLETRIRSVLKEYMERGKVDVYCAYEDYSEEGAALHYNEALAGEYLKHLREMGEHFQLEFDVKVSMLSRFPDIFMTKEPEPDEDQLFGLLEKPLRDAAAAFSDSREKEGENLKEDLLEKLSLMSSFVEQIEQRAPGILEEYKANLREKIEELLSDNTIDEGRLAAEVILYADKICVDEETVRLKSHIAAMESELKKGGAVGRKLDFIAQEMNREANTILSKSTDLSVSDLGIELKTNIEKIREQVQNIE